MIPCNIVEKKNHKMIVGQFYKVILKFLNIFCSIKFILFMI